MTLLIFLHWNNIILPASSFLCPPTRDSQVVMSKRTQRLTHTMERAAAGGCSADRFVRQVLVRSGIRTKRHLRRNQFLTAGLNNRGPSHEGGAVAKTELYCCSL